MERIFAEVILPLAFKGTFTFEVTDTQMQGSIKVGSLVYAPLGKSKLYVGVVDNIHYQTPNYKIIKSLNGFYSENISISTLQLKFWHWISEYYMCTIGEVMKAALPPSLNLNNTPPVITSYSIIKPLDQALDSTLRSKKQQQILLLFEKETNITRSEILKAVTGGEAAIKALIDKGILQKKQSSETKEMLAQEICLPELSAIQQSAYNMIISAFAINKPVLLHGVTGSGKTEVYTHLIAKCLANGEDVLYLVPEIVLTTQLTERLTKIFGDNVIIYHSMSTSNHRSDIHIQQQNPGRSANIILGARSALFLPTRNLGLIIVDEEHETSYKQNDPAPRYNGKDAAIMMAKLSGANVILGSATPSIESFYNAASGKYALVKLDDRYGDAIAPTIIISDTSTAYSRGDRKAQFNKILLDKICSYIANNKQVLLFQNRRGYAPYVECTSCGTIPLCPNCNVTLTLHKRDNTLKCHYCGHTKEIPVHCPTCKTGTLKPKGFGTERIEQELQALLPSIRIARMDSDTITTARQYTRIIDSIENGEVDVIIGTQMVSKGLDLKAVGLVGILNADNLLFYPDFRASERAYQMLSQVSGRAGRRDKSSEAIIQTSQPENNTIRQAAASDYVAMYNEQIAEREKFLYPPFCRLISITLKHRDKEKLNEIETIIGEDLEQIFGARLLGPESPAIDKIRDEYLSVFLLKIERSRSFAGAKNFLAEYIDKLNKNQSAKGLTLIIDIDPM